MNTDKKIARLIDNAIDNALREERSRLSNLVFALRRTKSQFDSVKECIAYNNALDDAADKILESDT